MLGNVFKAYDIRGVYPDALTDNMAWQIGYGSSAYLLADAAASGKRDPMMTYIVVGRDMRSSSPKLAGLLAEGITEQGGNVIDVGMVDTPFVYFAINRLDCAGGVAVTASHNPPQYNGFKVSKRRAKPVGEGFGLEEIRKQAAMADRTKLKALRKDPSKQREPLNPVGRTETRDLWDAYREHVLQFVDREAIAKRGLRVVVDASNAMAGTMTPKVFGEAEIEGLEIIPLHFDNTKGEFAHEPNPLVAANLADVRAKVREEKADLGICFDGDADRCMLVDERGEIVGCDLLTAWLAVDALKRSPGSPVVYDLRSSKAVEEEVRKAGGDPVRSRVGHVFMKERMAARDAVFGGELSGHFYFRDNFYADSGAIAMATALSALARDRKPMSRIIKPLARYAQSGEVNFEVEDKDAALEALEERFAIRGEIDTLDGVTIDCWDPDGWWFNVRKSNTEPLLRLNLEARDKSTLGKMMTEVSPLLGQPVSS